MKRMLLFVLVIGPIICLAQDNTKQYGMPLPQECIRLRCGLRTDTAKQPLLIVNDKRVESKTLQQISPNSILRIDVLKGAAAEAKYGESAANGVIVITLKCDAPIKDEKSIGFIL